MSAVKIARATATKINTGASAPSTRKINRAGQSNGFADGPSASPTTTPSTSPTPIRR
jgi:hypothetical protein